MLVKDMIVAEPKVLPKCCRCPAVQVAQGVEPGGTQALPSHSQDPMTSSGSWFSGELVFCTLAAQQVSPKPQEGGWSLMKLEVGLNLGFQTTSARSWASEVRRCWKPCPGMPMGKEQTKGGGMELASIPQSNGSVLPDFCFLSVVSGSLSESTSQGLPPFV